MPEGIVDMLQSVQIRRNDNNAHIFSAALFQLLVELAIETTPVQKPCHVVVDVELFQFAVCAFQLHIDGFGVHLGVEDAQRRIHGVHETIDLFVGIMRDIRLECTVAHYQIQKVQGAEDDRIFPPEHGGQIGDQLFQRRDAGILGRPEIAVIHDVDLFAERLAVSVALAKIRRTEDIVVQCEHHALEDKLVLDDFRQFCKRSHAGDSGLYLAGQFLALVGTLELVCDILQ